MSNIKLIVTDIGGTLLADNNTVSEENKQAFKYAKEKGVLIALATARMYSSTKFIANAIDADYGIYGNGIHLMDIQNLKTLKKTIMNYQLVEKLIKYAKSRNIYVHLSEELYDS
jgi:HAD superfamily hydrolase (TIGR01484 family)